MTHEELFAKTTINTWKLGLERLDKMFSSLSDEELQTRVAPERNRVFYLLGHLTAVHDRLFPLLSLGQRLHPELDDDFLTNPDGKSPDRVSAADLRRAWSEVNTKLTAAFDALPPADWLQKHEAVSEEDFAKEPHRNRLAVVQSRTLHAGFHAGQIVLALKRQEA
ncbi:MAG TPA: DinB family protein [Thermoanaerobaculia bacterium]|nr:DinB family protein [Thermoanaerobaculia bacterium]